MSTPKDVLVNHRGLLIRKMENIKLRVEANKFT